MANVYAVPAPRPGYVHRRLSWRLGFRLLELLDARSEPFVFTGQGQNDLLVFSHTLGTPRWVTVVLVVAADTLAETKPLRRLYAFVLAYVALAETKPLRRL